jgi:predicted transcriptional regulator
MKRKEKSSGNRKKSRELVAADRRKKAWRLKTEGELSNTEIAAQLGVSGATVSRYLTAGLASVTQLTTEHAETYRTKQIQRLESMYAEAGQEDSVSTRIRTRLSVIDRLNKLHGIDTPVKHIHTDGTDELAFANAPEGESLDRLRKARAEMAEMDIAQRKLQLVPMETVQASFDIIKRHLDRFGDQLRRYGNTSIPAPELLDKHNEMIRAIMADSERLKK